jgi:hypothetical protein
MRATLLIAVLVSFLAPAVHAQTPVPVPIRRPLSLVQDFLGLTNAQVDAILQNNDAYARYVAEKQTRISQVRGEIADWTAATTLDPMELGMRYVEIEYQCRQMKTEGENSQKRNLAVLTDAQKAKLKSLDDALKLMPVVYEAQSANIFGTPTTPQYAGFGFTSGVANLLLGFPTVGGAPGCFAVPTAVERVGDFSGIVR